MPDIRKIVVNGVAMDIVSKTDPTLTQENIPGDAKVIGTKIEIINNNIDVINNNITNLETMIEDSMQEVFNANTHYDFPSIGSVNCIYKAYKEKKTYQWNAESMVYEPLNENSLDQINLINGGNANGN